MNRITFILKTDIEQFRAENTFSQRTTSILYNYIVFLSRREGYLSTEVYYCDFEVLSVEECKCVIDGGGVKRSEALPVDVPICHYLVESHVVFGFNTYGYIEHSECNRNEIE